MLRIILFLLRNQYKLVFSSLLVLSIALVINHHFYHRFRFLSSANWACGKLLEVSADFSSYLKLKESNRSLVKENKLLRARIFNLESMSHALGTTAKPYVLNEYKVIHAHVIKNSFSKAKNYITINKGSLDGIKKDMAVINPEGVIGIVENTSWHFSTIQSILNDKTMINAQIKGTNTFGTLKWDTTNFNIVQLEDIPSFVNVKVNDTIVTAGMSHIFPKNIPIGSVEDLHIVGNYHIINVRLFSDMTSLGYVYIVENTMRNEIIELEAKNENE